MNGSLLRSSNKHEEFYLKFDKLLMSGFDYKDAMEKHGLKQGDVDLLYEKISNLEFVPKFIHEKLLLLFLNASKTDIDAAARIFTNFYQARRNAPEFFTGRNVFSQEIQKALDNQIYLTLPVTPNNCSVSFQSLRSFDPKTHNFDTFLKTVLMSAEAHSFRNGLTDGVIMIIDLKGCGMKHLFQASISSVRKGIDFVQNACPVPLVAVHILNSNYLMNIVLSMIKPFLSKKYYEMIHLHKSGTCDDEFFEKWVPRSHMPFEYGGTLGTIDELHEQNRQHLYKMHEYFITEEQITNLDFNDIK